MLSRLVDLPGRAQWSQRYRELEAYRQANGDCCVPKGQGALGRWVARQRELYKKGTLNQDREAQLRKLGFVWNTNDHAWDSRYNKLKQYRAIHGHACVPCAEGDLGVWVAKQRQNKRKGKLDPVRQRRLDELGFVWDTPSLEWNEKFEMLAKWKTAVGDCRVPFNEGELGWWVNTQRQRKRKGQLPKEREEKLNEIGFIWNPQGAPPAPSISASASLRGASSSTGDLAAIESGGGGVIPRSTSAGGGAPMSGNGAGAGAGSSAAPFARVNSNGTSVADASARVAGPSRSSSLRRRKRRISDDGSSSIGSKRHASDLSESSFRLGFPESSSQSSFDSFRDSDPGTPAPSTPVYTRHSHGHAQAQWRSVGAIEVEDQVLPPIHGISTPLPSLSQFYSEHAPTPSAAHTAAPIHTVTARSGFGHSRSSRTHTHGHTHSRAHTLEPSFTIGSRPTSTSCGVGGVDHMDSYTATASSYPRRHLPNRRTVSQFDMLPSVHSLAVPQGHQHQLLPVPSPRVAPRSIALHVGNNVWHPRSASAEAVGRPLSARGSSSSAMPVSSLLSTSPERDPVPPRVPGGMSGTNYLHLPPL